MLKESFKDKIIGILGYQTFTGQILLKKIL